MDERNQKMLLYRNFNGLNLNSAATADPLKIV